MIKVWENVLWDRSYLKYLGLKIKWKIISRWMIVKGYLELVNSNKWLLLSIKYNFWLVMGLICYFRIYF